MPVARGAASPRSSTVSPPRPRRRKPHRPPGVLCSPSIPPRLDSEAESEADNRPPTPRSSRTKSPPGPSRTKAGDEVSIEASPTGDPISGESRQGGRGIDPRYPDQSGPPPASHEGMGGNTCRSTTCRASRPNSQIGPRSAFAASSREPMFGRLYPIRYRLQPEIRFLFGPSSSNVFLSTTWRHKKTPDRVQTRKPLACLIRFIGRPAPAAAHHLGPRPAEARASSSPNGAAPLPNRSLSPAHRASSAPPTPHRSPAARQRDPPGVPS